VSLPSLLPSTGESETTVDPAVATEIGCCTGGGNSAESPDAIEAAGAAAGVVTGAYR
jgi:hypothetical protein